MKESKKIITSFSLSEDELKTLKREAKLMGVSRSKFIRGLLKAWTEYQLDRG